MNKTVVAFALWMGTPSFSFAAEQGGFGFPEWMDFYFVLLTMLIVPVFFLVMVVKPRGVRIWALGRSSLGPVQLFSYRLLKGVLVAFFTLMTLGIITMVAA